MQMCKIDQNVKKGAKCAKLCKMRICVQIMQNRKLAPTKTWAPSGTLVPTQTLALTMTLVPHRT